MSASNRGMARRRLGLLAGGSLMAATLMAFGGVALAPTAAFADNECGNPNTNTTAADTFQCTDAATFTAITYPSTNGNLTLQLQNDVTVTTGGIVIAPTGINSVSITRIADSPANSGDPQITSLAGAGISVIRPTLSTGGAVTINLSDNDATDTPMSITGATAGILVSNAGNGATTVTTTNGTITATVGWGVELGSTGTGSVTFNNRSVVSGTAGAFHVSGGNAATLTNGSGGVLLGDLDFDNTGAVTFGNSGTWRAAGTSNLGSGTSGFTNGGVLAISGAAEGAATATLSGLETFANTGAILFGANSGYTATDGVANDRLVAATAFSGAGRLVMDVMLGGEQLDCSAAVTADCFDLRGGSATGTATILINPVAGAAGVLGARQVLVDVAGAGELAKTAFVLNSGVAGYREVANETPVIDTGPVVYRLLYDNAAQQVYLTAAPDREPAQLAHLGEGAQAAWTLTTEGWLNRQADMRAAPAQAGHGVWLSAVTGRIENSVEQSFAGGGFVYDTGYQQRSTALVGGVDILGSGDQAWKVGVTGGYVNSEMELDVGAATYEMEGYSVGAYASLLAGGFFVDAIASYAKLDVSATGLTAEGEATSTGVQAEGGYRYATPAGLVTIEPLVALAYVSTELGQAAFITGGDVSLDDVTSLRGALGVRLTGEMGSDVTTRFSFTGRVWQEFDGEAAINLTGGGVADSFTYEDERDVLGDMAFAVSVLGLAQGLSLDAGARLKIKEDYTAGDLSIGLRYAF